MGLGLGLWFGQVLALGGDTGLSKLHFQNEVYHFISCAAFDELRNILVNRAAHLQ